MAATIHHILVCLGKGYCDKIRLLQNPKENASGKFVDYKIVDGALIINCICNEDVTTTEIRKR